VVIESKKVHPVPYSRQKKAGEMRHVSGLTTQYKEYNEKNNSPIGERESLVIGCLKPLTVCLDC